MGATTRSCDFCGEDTKKGRSVKVSVDRKTYGKWRLCKGCAAGLLVVVTDRRKHRKDKGFG